MDIQLNGKRTPVPATTTVGDLIRKNGLDPSTVVVEHNLAILTAAELDQVILKESDTLEILRFVGGG